MIKMTEVTKPVEKERRDVPINIKITKGTSDWIKKNNISPTLVFDKAIEELRAEQEKKHGKRIIIKDKPNDY